MSRAWGKIRPYYVGPPNWVITHVNVESRRAFGFWTIIFAVIGSFFFGRMVLWVTVLSVLALIPNYASETPVETE